jgi:uncharacterized protein with PIN domain
VEDRLEPLTRAHYDQFNRCVACSRIYWRGSHHRQLSQVVEKIHTAL